MPRGLTKLILASAVISISGFSFYAQDPNRKSATDSVALQIVGTWRGNSLCAVAGSPCHDEINVYRFSDIAGKPGWFSVTASKLVEDKEIVMGTGEWQYEGEKHALKNETAGGTFRLTVEDNRMEGTLTLRDNTVYRRIHLKKER